MSKQTRKRFPAQSNYRAEQVLDLIHGDLCGPILPETSGGNKYFLLLVDDYSRAMWVYFLKTKDEAFDAFKKFRAQVERDPDKRVKNFRTNREGEFCSNNFISYYENFGIYRQFTASYTPQQIGIVERHYPIVVAIERSLINTIQLASFL